MRKNGSRLISLKQYKLSDLFVFAVILAGFDLISHFALVAYQGSWTFSLLVPVTLLVMMRWGWQSIFYAAGDGLLYCVLNASQSGFRSELYAVYIIGNAFLALCLILLRLVGKEKIAKKWWLSMSLAVVGWFLVVIGRATVAACCGYSFVSVLLEQLSDIFSLGVAAILILVLRRIDGMFEDQVAFLKRTERERLEKSKADDFGLDPVEIDEETLKVLDKSNDLYD